eukprot:gnl/TRDRNA2_/TRDRNA2_120427_c1_seq1.p1 gnl/TRDRNA2_/TRDRNA2_120427_c1~~gnl/TRDRNA2_/TRDRNA2_120427_c1_seq1.p1  ORF type:complete len:140 (+),score=11.34 gnl/TRDRNA2_/TRDRNA2_120427_c1_seq1:60-422(+)
MPCAETLLCGNPDCQDVPWGGSGAPMTPVGGSTMTPDEALKYFSGECAEATSFSFLDANKKTYYQKIDRDVTADPNFNANLPCVPFPTTAPAAEASGSSSVFASSTAFTAMLVVVARSIL